MNGLVAYDSSSDEDSKSPKRQAQPVSSGAKEDAGTPTRTNNDSTTSTGAKPMSVSLIGPEMPSDSSQLYETTDLVDLPQDMSEQDFVRHLTQSTHPMTAIPPSPPGSPDAAAEARFKKFLSLKPQGLHFNEDLAKKSSFRNPALFSTMLEKNGLGGDAQYASSLPLSVWNPQAMPSHGYKEALVRNQQSIRDQQSARKKQAIASGRRTIDFAPASGSATSSQTSTPGESRKLGGV